METQKFDFKIDFHEDEIDFQKDKIDFHEDKLIIMRTN